MLTQSQLKEFVTYDPDTGIFIWKHRLETDHYVKIWNTRRAGTIAGGCFRYRYIKIGLRTYLAHRLAWLYMTGEWPKNHIDHIDGDKTNNSFKNLREATFAENMRNRPIRQNNTSGHKGVYQTKNGSWYAQIRIPGTDKALWLGIHATKEEASKVRREAEIKYFGTFAHQP